ncbi:flavin-containing monooxygenase [Oleiphilus messinensis]|uniref:Flavin-containing monooxygenase n=1 Tax=Oleiphilus messinensis TaxID=141451 RepID=A0A1Y0I6C1_9GAMM|nr:NAD(P)/FAD-dependent oxidoreductase [Oleiphilus messinensis]ARU55770.1 flavin-containing monooxygenase [Oleiphilus messinensis]
MSALPKTTSTAQHHRVIIIGTGFAGLGMAIKLKEQGENDFIVIEKESGVGGTWRVNHYPGCACDVQSHLYSYSFEPNPNWTRMFAPQPEIRGYLEGCAQKYGINPHIRFDTAVQAMHWDEQNCRWNITDHNGNAYTADVVVSGMGGLSTPAYPTIKGLDTFKGKMFHSQQWEHDYSLAGKKVAVIGTGASAIQFVPQIQGQVKELKLFQRTPPWILPKPDREITKAEQLLFKRLPGTQRAMRAAIYTMLESRVAAFAINPKLMAFAKRWALNHIRSEIKDPELRKKVTPDYTVGCKRILISNDYYRALSQQNVDVITTGIQEVTENGVITSDGKLHEVDTIIFGTGFKATDPVPANMIFGRGGKDIIESWDQGPQAYKGTTVAGYPNFYILMGPNTGLGHSSMVYMIESQIEYVLGALSIMDKRKIAALDVKEAIQNDYNNQIDAKTQGTVWNVGSCNSWYIHPVSGKNTTLWPGYTWKFRQQTKNFDLKAYRVTQRNTASTVSAETAFESALASSANA